MYLDRCTWYLVLGTERPRREGYTLCFILYTLYFILSDLGARGRLVIWSCLHRRGPLPLGADTLYFVRCTFCFRVHALWGLRARHSAGSWSDALYFTRYTLYVIL